MLSYIRRDGKACNTTRILHSSKSNANETSPKTVSKEELDKDDDFIHFQFSLSQENQSNSQSDAMRKKVRERISTTVFFRNGKDSVQNEAFEEIGDDDL